MNAEGKSASHFLTTNIMTCRCTPPYSITRWVSSHKKANSPKQRERGKPQRRLYLGLDILKKGKLPRKNFSFGHLPTWEGEPVPLLINGPFFLGSFPEGSVFSHLETSAVLFSHIFWNHSITIERNAHFISRHYNNRCPKEINSQTIKQIYSSPFMDSKGTKYSKP